MREIFKVFCGEFLGTFILVFIGISSVAVSVLFKGLIGLFQVAAVWGIGVTLAIYATRYLSCAHLNPAVSLGMVLAGRMNPRLLSLYWFSQLLGGIAAGAVLYILFHHSIERFEMAHGIVRGASNSVLTAMLFGEYFPNPAMSIPWFNVSLKTAMFTEGFGTFLLVLMIFMLTEGCNLGRPSESASPLFIGATVSCLIAITAPITQTGINPARDFGPRIVAYLAGWGHIAIPGPKGGFFLVYILSPLIGGAISAFLFRFVLEPLMSDRELLLICNKDKGC